MIIIIYFTLIWRHLYNKMLTLEINIKKKWKQAQLTLMSDLKWWRYALFYIISNISAKHGTTVINVACVWSIRGMRFGFEKLMPSSDYAALITICSRHCRSVVAHFNAVVQTFIHKVASLCKCDIVWMYIFTFATAQHTFIL